MTDDVDPDAAEAVAEMMNVATALAQSCVATQSQSDAAQTTPDHESNNSTHH